MRFLRVAILSLTVTLVAATVAAAGTWLGNLSLSASSGDPEDTITATGSGFEPIGDVELFWDAVNGPLLADVPVGRDGGFQVRFTVPTSSFGGHNVIACRDRNGATCREEAVAKFTVNPPPTTTTTTQPTTTTTTTTTRPPTTTTVTPPPPSVVTTTSTTLPVGVTTTVPPTISPTVPPVVGVTTTFAPPPTVPPAVTPPTPVEWPDLGITAMEVTQGIQNLANDMPLVADRRTAVRVYVEVIGQDLWQQVSAVLEARVNGVSLGMIPPDNGPITALVDGGNRLNVDDTLNFSLPHNWTAAGEVELRALVWSFDPGSIYDEPTPINNLTSDTFEFHEGTDAIVHPVALHTHRGGDPNDVERTFWGGLFGLETENSGLEGYDSGDAIDSLNGLYRYHPVAHVEVDPFPAELHPTGHSEGTEWQFLGCFTTITAVEGPDAPDVQRELRVADWEVFFDDPDSLDPATFTSPLLTTPTYQGLIVADRVYTVATLSIDSDTGEVVLSGEYGNDTFFGSLPEVGGRAHPSGCQGPGLNNSAPNAQMALWQVAYDWAPAGEYFLGMLHPLLRSEPGGLASTADAAWARMFNLYGSEWRHSGAWLVGHEIGHLTGLAHTGCAIDAGVDLNHPVESYPECQLAPVGEEGFMGFDVYHDLWPVDSPMVFSNDPRAQPVAHRAFPFMSYQRPGYPDPYNWCLMLNYYGVPCDTADLPLFVEVAIGGPRDLEIPVPPPIDGLDLDSLPVAIIAGSVDEELGLATFAPQAGHSAIILERGITSAPDLWRFDGAAGSPTVRVLQDGALLYQAPIAVGTSDAASAVVAFTAEVPVHPGLTVEILSPDGEVWGSETIGPNLFGGLTTGQQAAATTTTTIDAFPTEIVSLDLSGSLPPGSVFQVEYSPDGDRWLPVGEPTTTAPKRVTGDELSNMPGSDSGEVRVVVRDGWHVAHFAAGRVAVAQKAPFIAIAAVDAPTTYPMNARVRVEAGAADLEDGSLSAAIQWTSSIDGPLGSGRVLETTNLAAGVHTLTAVAVDSAGAVSSSSTTITIDAASARPRLDDTTTTMLEGLITSLTTIGELPQRAAQPAGAATDNDAPTPVAQAPATPGAGGGSPIGWIGLLFVLVAGAAVAFRSRLGGGTR